MPCPCFLARGSADLKSHFILDVSRHFLLTFLQLGSIQADRSGNLDNHPSMQTLAYFPQWQQTRKPYKQPIASLAFSCCHQLGIIEFIA